MGGFQPEAGQNTCDDLSRGTILFLLKYRNYHVVKLMLISYKVCMKYYGLLETTPCWKLRRICFEMYAMYPNFAPISPAFHAERTPQTSLLV